MNTITNSDSELLTHVYGLILSWRRLPGLESIGTSVFEVAHSRAQVEATLTVPLAADSIPPKYSTPEVSEAALK